LVKAESRIKIKTINLGEFYDWYTVYTTYDDQFNTDQQITKSLILEFNR
jgi:hypothetical protein